MKKNIGTQEAHVRTIIGVMLLLLTILFIENPWVKIFFAVIAAVLAITAFLRTCPINLILKRDTYDNVPITDTPIPTIEVESTDDEKITVEEKTSTTENQ